MKYLLEYKNEKIYKMHGFFTTGIMAADFSNLDFLKKLIDIEHLKKNIKK